MRICAQYEGVKQKEMKMTYREEMTIDQDKAQFLAATFLDVVWEWTTPEELAEIKRRNATPEYEDNCATHDFFDANEAMADAFRRAFGRLPLQAEDGSAEHDADCAMWNAAWEIAHKDLTDSAN
jgi:hypothetical protein